MRVFWCLMSPPHIFLYNICESYDRIGATEPFGGSGGCSQRTRFDQQSLNLVCKSLWRQFALFDTPGAARFGKSDGVVQLVVVQSMW